MNKLSAEDSKRVSTILGRLDKVAEVIQEKSAEWGMPFDEARSLVNELDSASDNLEQMAFGPESLERRQIEVMAKVQTKEAEVIQRDADEGYMATFETGAVIQQDADEPYMAAYRDDDTSGVNHGTSTTGRPLT